MSKFAVPITILAVLSAARADVSHLANQNGYHYSNVGLTSGLNLHTPENNPAPTQYHNTYGDTGVAALPNSYVPPPSGSPFDGTAPLPKTYTDTPSARLSVPLQSPLIAGQKYQAAQAQQTYQQQNYQQSRDIPAPTYQQQNQADYTQYNTAYTQPQVQTQAQTQYQAQAQVQAQPQYQAQQNSQEPIITKHFYVHAAPEEPEEEVGPKFVEVGRPRKNYKIIFIKTPSYGLKSQVIPVLPRTEDKTIVYVLSKKPTFDQNIQLPEPAPIEPSKPDVFFIKYKTKEEAEQAQQQIQEAYDHANLAGADDVGNIAARFTSGTDSGSSAFGGQDSETEQNQYGGQHTSTTHTKRNA